MFATPFVLGHHGCDKGIGEGILRNDDHVAVSKNRYDWLGEGAYFWENSPERAREWAEFLKKHPPQANRRIANPFVVGAIIELGNCLDLTDATSLQIVRAGYEEFQRANALAGAKLPVNEPAHGDDLIWSNVTSIAQSSISSICQGSERDSPRSIPCAESSPKEVNVSRCEDSIKNARASLRQKSRKKHQGLLSALGSTLGDSAVSPTSRLAR